MLEIKDKEELAEKIQELEEKGDKETLIKRKQVDRTQLGSVSVNVIVTVCNCV